MGILLLILVGLLAFINGANDNAKGVATLVSYGAATPRAALRWATVTTAIGAIASFWLAGGLLSRFSGSGFFAGSPALPQSFFIAALIGACGWVCLATRFGLPVSTTHAITGALLGAGWIRFGIGSFQLNTLAQRIALPLALSPLLSLLIVYVIAWPVGVLANRAASRCICASDDGTDLALPSAAAPGSAHVATSTLAVPLLVAGEIADCRAEGATSLITGVGAANALHWIASGLVGFARGWNDAPKIAALGIAASLAGGMTMLSAPRAFALVTFAMAAGGLVYGRRVLTTLSTKVTTLPLAESLAASITTATLVGLASWRAMPVSTTQVSTGAIIGGGLKHDPRSVHWRKVGEIALSWLITIPVAAAIAALVQIVVARL